MASRRGPAKPASRMRIEADRPDHWSERAACRDVDSELFFPIGHTSAADLLQADQAKAVCWRCAVRPQCLNWALGDDTRPPEQFGVWGGYDELERQHLMRRPVRTHA